MARTTKYELQQYLNARTTECVALRTECSELRATVASLRGQLDDLRATHPVLRVQPGPSPYKQAAAKARALAAKTGHAVKVGA